MADLNYYESGYIDAGFFVYTADAASAISSSASMTCDAGKVVSAESSLASEFTQTTYASRTKDIDLYAFSEAAIAVQVSVIRTTNIAATAVFDISTDGRRFRDIASAEDAVFNIDIVNERSRATSMETQAAFSITADVEVITPYIEGAADLTVESSLGIPGERTLEVSSSQSSSSTISVIGSKTSTTAITVDSQVTVTATISHIHGADLTAFSNASISALAEVTRNTTIDLTANSTVDSTVERIQSALGSLNSELQITAIGVTNLTLAAAFTCSSTLESTAEKYNDLEISLSSSTDINVANIRIRYTNSDLSSSTSVSAVLSNIYGADLTAFGQASLSIESSVLYTANINLISQAITDISISKNTESSANISVVSNIYASRYFGSGRPRNISSNLSYDSTIKKFGSHSLTNISGVRSDNHALHSYTQTAKLHEPFVFESWYYNTEHYTDSGSGMGVGSSRLLSHWWFQPIANGAFTFYQSNYSTPFPYTSRTSATNILQLNSWNHILIVADPAAPGNEPSTYQISIYVNGSRALQVYRHSDNASWQNSYHTYDYLYLRDLGSNARLDDVSLHIGSTLGYSTTATTITVPTSPRVNDPTYTRLLWHFDGNGLDDTAATLSANASISSNFIITTTISGPVHISAALLSTSSMTASGQRTAETILTAFSDAALSITATRIQQAQCSAEVETSQSTQAAKLVTVDSTQSVVFDQSTQAVKTTDAVITTDAVATELAIVAKIGDFLVSADVISELAVQAVKTTETSATLAFDVAANIQAEKIVDAVCFMEPIGFLTLNDISVIRTTSATLTSNSEQNTVGEKLAGLVGNLQSEFNLTATSSGTIDAIALVMSSGTLAITVERQRPGSATLDSAFTQTTETYDSLAKQGTAALEIIITTTSDVHRIRDVEIATDAVASELVAVGRIGQGFITCETYVTVDAQVVKTTDIDLTITAVSTVAVIADKLHSTAVAVLDVNAALLAEGTTNITGEADLTVLANISADARRSRGFNSTITANSNLVCDTGRIRPFAELVVAAATLTSTASRIRSASSHFDAIASELVLGDAITSGSATLSAAFTLTAQGRDIDLTKYVYTIGSETRFHKIQSENRTRKIREETRIYKIRRA